MSTGPLRTAIVGAGLMGHWHARAARRAGSRVSVIVDRDADRARRLAAVHGARIVRDLTELGRDIDVVHVCTPLATHESVVQSAIDAGMHALVEKPLTESASSTAALLERASARGVLLCPVHQFTHQRGVRRVVGERSRIGRVLHVSMTVCSAGADLPGAADRDDVAADILPHPLSLFGALIDDVELSALDWTVIRSAPGEWRAMADAGGTSLSLLISMSGRPTLNSLHVIGDAGSARANLFHGFAVIESGRVSRASKIGQPFALSSRTFAAALTNLGGRALRREQAYPGLAELVARFHGAVRGTAPTPFTPEHTLDVARARDALIELALGAVVSRGRSHR